MLSCLGSACFLMLMASCGNAESSTTTSRCHNAEGLVLSSEEEVALLLKDGLCFNADGVARPRPNVTFNTTTTTIEEPTWVFGDTGDPVGDSLNAFVAPFVQPVCDTLRQWKPPAETTKEEFNDFSKQVAQLKKMIGSPSKPTFKDTYWVIYSLAEEALDYERRHPNDEYSAFTASMGPRECDRLNFTTANSKFGIDINNPETSSESTMAPSSGTNSSPDKPKTNTTQKPATRPEMLSSANRARLKRECLQVPGCGAQYEWYEDFVNRQAGVTSGFTSSKACMSFFRDLIAFLGTYPDREPTEAWLDVNWDRC